LTGYIYQQISFSFFFSPVLGFEPRVLHMLGRCFTICAALAALSSLVIFQIGSQASDCSPLTYASWEAEIPDMDHHAPLFVEMKVLLTLFALTRVIPISCSQVLELLVSTTNPGQLLAP
jgi:hypothetical protein